VDPADLQVGAGGVWGVGELQVKETPLTNAALPHSKFIGEFAAEFVDAGLLT
jgi:hypothetical protein